jgi:hypothetical protein
VELAVRKDSDRFVKQGAYGALQARLCDHRSLLGSMLSM